MKKLNERKIRKNLEKTARYDLENNKVFGCAYHVYQKDNFSLKKCFGNTTADKISPVTENTLFRLASMTKPVTAFAALILADKGLICLDDTIDKYLPQFRGIHIIDAGGADKGVPQKMPKIRNLLSHNAGIGSDPEKFARMTAEDNKTLDSAVSYFVRAGLDFEPESTQMYSATGSFDVMVKIAETVTGTDFLTFLKNELFIPCQMTDTTFLPDEEQSARIIDMHTNVNGRNAVRSMPDDSVFENIPMTHFLGGGGLVSSLSDYGKFAKLLLNRGKTDDEREIVSEKTFSAFASEQFKVCRDQSWGLGVRLITHSSYPYLPAGSFGWSGAYGTHFWVDPENEIFAILMKNSSVDGGAGNESAVMLEKAVYESF